MSMIAPPNQQQPSLPSPPEVRSTWLAREWRHWVDMPPLTLCLLVLPSIILLVLDPLLPIAAYALWLWASHSWSWRDRWTSIWAWAKQGGAFVALMLLYAALSSINVWIFPQLTANAQAFWHAHLGGDLSLSPSDLDGLVVRTLLLLPLAPALALCYEWLDPRTRVQLQRILTPADLVEPKTDETKASSTVSSKTQATPPSPSASAKAPPKAATPQRKRARKPPQQITIESFLASDRAQAKSLSPPYTLS
jgi:hypothetical protein